LSTKTLTDVTDKTKLKPKQQLAARSLRRKPSFAVLLDK